jgi:hypothetical protein
MYKKIEQLARKLVLLKQAILVTGQPNQAAFRFCQRELKLLLL